MLPEDPVMPDEKEFVYTLDQLQSAYKALEHYCPSENKVTKETLFLYATFGSIFESDNFSDMLSLIPNAEASSMLRASIQRTFLSCAKLEA